MPDFVMSWSNPLSMVVFTKTRIGMAVQRAGSFSRIWHAASEISSVAELQQSIRRPLCSWHVDLSWLRMGRPPAVLSRLVEELGTVYGEIT